MGPVRLQLSRAKGFSLQAHSLEINGLPAVNVARPSRWGNPFVLLSEEGFPLIEGPGYCAGVEDDDWEEASREVVRLFRERSLDGLPNMSVLRGKNLACWCKIGEGFFCHADVLLEIANRDAPTHPAARKAGRRDG